MNKNSKEVEIEKETKKENLNQEEKKIEKKNNLAFLAMLVVVAVIVLLVINFILSSIFNKPDINTDISKVKKILNEKYSDIDCINTSCNYIVATNGDLIKKTNYQIFNLNGKKISDFTVDNSKENDTISLVDASENYVIIKKTNDDKTTYILKNKNGKNIYSTENQINVLNDNYVIVKESEYYNILDKKGKEKYNKISDYSKFYDGQYVSIKRKDKNIILNSKGKELLKNYEISKEVVLDNELLYLIVKSDLDNLYYYYNAKNNKIVGDGFNNYSNSDKKGKVTITKIEGNNQVKYVLDKNGTQEKLALSDDQNQIKSVIKDKIDTDKYYLYSYGIKDPNQESVLVDNRSDKSFGILNVKTKDYKKLYSYKQNRKSVFSSITELKSYNNYVQISCSISNCDEAKTYIYDLENNKEIYSQTGNDLVISSYVQYDDYKVIQYSKNSANGELSGKYVLYNKEDKQIYSSDNFIYVVDKKLKFGNIANSYIILFNTKDNKTLNSENNLASKITLGDNYVFNYRSDDDNNVICTSSGKEIVNIDLSDYITYSNSNIIYIHDSRLYIYNAARNKTKNYKIKANEKLNSESSKIINPYRGAVFINNTADKQMKILNSKARVIRSSKNVVISSVKLNKKDGVALIIVKKNTKNKDQYGLYIAK